MLIVREIISAFEMPIIGRAKNIHEALQMIPSAYHSLEEDRDHPGHYDLMNLRGQQFTIEPEKNAA
jgi:hypothetical protein